MSSGTSDQRDKAVEEVEKDNLGGEDYSDNFEEGEEGEEEGEVDDEHPDDNDTEQPARPSAPVWCKLKKENCESMNERLLQGGVVSLEQFSIEWSGIGLVLLYFAVWLVQ